MTTETPNAGSDQGHASDELDIHQDVTVNDVARDPHLDDVSEQIPKYKDSRRFRQARKLIEKPGLFFWCFVDNIETTITGEPDDYSPSRYERHIAQYTGYRHDYTVDFDLDGAEWNWSKWRNHSDIGISVIEKKMPLDKRIRYIITAYKMLVEKNQKSHVFTKRMLQLGFGGGLLALIALTSILAPMEQSYLFSEHETWQLVMLLFVSSSVVSFLFVLFHLWAVQGLTGALRDKMRQSSTSLKASMVSKTGGILSQFEVVLRKASNANNEYLPNQREWIDHAIWYSQVAMWLPKRVDYIERYFQLEMQNIRAVRNKLAIIGDTAARVTGIVLAAGLCGLAFAMEGGANVMAGAMALPGLIAFALMYHHSTSRKNSIQNREIKGWIGDRSWKSVSEFDMFKKVADIMRPYMSRVFVEDNKGATLPGAEG